MGIHWRRLRQCISVMKNTVLLSVCSSYLIPFPTIKKRGTFRMDKEAKLDLADWIAKQAKSNLTD